MSEKQKVPPISLIQYRLNPIIRFAVIRHIKWEDGESETSERGVFDQHDLAMIAGNAMCRMDAETHRFDRDDDRVLYPTAWGELMPTPIPVGGAVHIGIVVHEKSEANPEGSFAAFTRYGPLDGEDWCRGNDLADGPATDENLARLFADIKAVVEGYRKAYDREVALS